MLELRDAQVSAFRRDLEELVEELFDHLTKKLPSGCRALGDEREVRAFIQRNLETAARWGVESVAGVAALLELFVQFGPSLERSPLREWSMRILSHPVMAGDLKAETVWERHHALTEGRPVVQA